MLQQILTDMFIAPELLLELNEDQKQILFLKMREEQVRRWREREDCLEREGDAQIKKVSGKSVSWRTGLDEQVWVWVMGEHPDDKPYDQICVELMRLRAAQQATKEQHQHRVEKKAELEQVFSAATLEPKVLDRGAEQMKSRSVCTQEEEDELWQKTLQKSKAADLRRRSLAKQTVEDHRRRSIKALERGRVAAMTKTFSSGGSAAPKPKPRTNPRPSSASRAHIVRWFQEEQLPLRAGYQRDHSSIAPWFHGIISREQAESLLEDGEPGSFLVRVSERVFGYVLSYRSAEGVQHLLVDAAENSYMLLGDQLRFDSLLELVEFHQVEPLSCGHQLLQACGQKKSGVLDYTELFS